MDDFSTTLTKKQKQLLIEPWVQWCTTAPIFFIITYAILRYINILV